VKTVLEFEMQFSIKNITLKNQPFGITGLFFLAMCLVGIVLRLIPDFQSFWWDELYSVTNTYAYSSFGPLFFKQIITEANPPLYETLLYFWTILAGVSELSARLPSMIFGTISILVILYYGPKIIGIKPAFLLAALLSISWPAIRYSHEARSYSLLILLSVILMLHSIKLVMERKQELVSNRMVSLNILLGFLLCHTHYFGVVLYFSNAIILFLFLKKSRLKIMFASVFSMLLFVPWFVTNLMNINTPGANWITQKSFLVSLEMLGRNSFYNQNFYLLVLLFVLILFLVSVRKSPNLFNSVVFSGLVIAVSMFTVFCTNLVRPIIVSRYLLAFLPYTYFIAAMVFSEPVTIKNDFGKTLIKYIPNILSIAVLLIMLVLTIEKSKDFKKADWKNTAASIQKIKNVEMIYCNGRPLNYYHYLRQNGSFSFEDIIKVPLKSKQMFKHPASGKVSVFWNCGNPADYQALRDSLSKNNFTILDEKTFYQSNYVVFR
jgi:uncharacterized membrane protein